MTKKIQLLGEHIIIVWWKIQQSEFIFIMCRNIKPLFNFEPPATSEEIQQASLQFVRKVSGFTKPSRVNEEAFTRGVSEIEIAVQKLLSSLVTSAGARDRVLEAERAKERSRKRFGKETK